MDEVSLVLEYNSTNFQLNVDMASHNGLRAGPAGAATVLIGGHGKTNGEEAATKMGRAFEQGLNRIEGSSRETTNVNCREYSLESDFEMKLYD